MCTVQRSHSAVTESYFSQQDIFAVYDTYKDHMILSDFVILLKKLTDLKIRYLSNLRISSDAVHPSFLPVILDVVL